MNLDRLRLRLTLGYLGISAVILALVLVAAVVGFSRELIEQQDTLLLQEARNQSDNVLTGEHRPTLAEGSASYGWVALDPDAEVTESDPAAPALGLPDRDLARRTLEEDGPLSRTLGGESGRARAVSLPMYRDDELVGTLQYAGSLASTRERVVRLILILLPLGLGGLGLGALGGLFMAGRAVRPTRDAFERQRVFVADASHELKTPLTLIRADAEVLRRGLETEEDRHLADDLLGEVDRMDALISDLLLVARLDAGELSLSSEPFDLAEAAQRAAERSRQRARSAGVELATETVGSVPALGDAARTEQILIGLLDNALDHTPPNGRVTVRVSGGSEAACASVRDTGPGIPPESVPHVFERFYRADSARTSGGGTGLGLAIARDLARAQGGDLVVATGNAEKGARFDLTLPVPSSRLRGV
ncbi:Histidine kinase-, DNA gyrase B-, and HSP90-like ATPase (plasmid) [Rubrobacter radiotolerans]|uniref:histidine kinase n=1 Tax=Rubrobacter radiotolerans TaxID=42256 RepID=A0A023X7Y6_RUBRA|nr:HAMP domain-containing sensor histidine kinase [Rubrobacter radiotolerans]AHY48331.1 Histidine kinase-, DNA gyrase B-, and HSP90-like ATPase [Rubrobacter radiotolerans]MDX5895467.1 HAMP domain-containing sensor histidine kinase [Rubrobacter radiotolerans]SMC01528.1 His Kinase A (phospho-acceptor) domain-containing protein [Rubrobacter radiotolerans DSM 5868]